MSTSHYIIFGSIAPEIRRKMGSFPLPSSSSSLLISSSSSISGRPSSTIFYPRRRFRQVLFLLFSFFSDSCHIILHLGSLTFSFLFQKGASTLRFLRLLLFRSKALFFYFFSWMINFVLFAPISFHNLRIINSCRVL